MRALVQKAFFIIVILLPVFIFTLDAQSEISPKVRVVQETNPIGAYTAPILVNESVVSPESCVTPAFLKSYYDGNVQKYLATLKKGGICAAGSLETSILQKKIVDAASAIAGIDQHMASLANTEKYLSTFSGENLNGLSLVAIPAGEFEAKTYDSATEISPMCLRDVKADTKNNVVVGNAKKEPGSFFNPIPKAALESIEILRGNSDKIKETVNKITLTKARYLNPLKNKKEVNEQIHMLGSAIGLSQAGQDLAAKHLMPITFEDLTKNYKSFQVNDQFMTVEVRWLGNKRETMAIPKGMLDIFSKYVPSTQIPKVTTHVSLGVDKQSFTGWLPEEDIYKQIQEVIRARRAEYIKQKAIFQGQVNSYKQSLDKLVANNYNCNEINL